MLNKIPHDKALHAIGGVLIFAVAITLSLSITLSLLIIAVIGVGKELLDAQDPKHHTADIWDAVATIALPLIVAIAIYIREM